MVRHWLYPIIMQSYQILQVKSIISRDRYVYLHTKDLFRLKLYRKIADRIIYIPEKGIFKCNKSTTYMHQDLGTTQMKNDTQFTTCYF